MALFAGNIFSRTLMMETQLYVSMPQDGRYYQKAPPPKTLILLHGISDNAAGWIRNSMAEFMANQYGIALVVPEVQRSFYQNMNYGLLYYDYITQELPKLCGELFNLSVKREDLMVAGLSMGGYGALKAAFGHPEVFSACGAFSSACDIKSTVRDYKEAEGKGEVGYRLEAELTGMFGEGMPVPDESDLFLLTEKVSRGTVKPRLYMTCGTEDFIRGHSLKLRDHLQSLPLDFKYEEWTGIHDWIFWNESLRRMLAYFLTPPTSIS
jgi:S-formylglutathione hydrolase FrmB